MPSQPEALNKDDIRGWQLHPVTRSLHKYVQTKVEDLKGQRPFTPGDPHRTYADIVRLESIQDTLENLLPLFTADIEDVQEQLSEQQTDE